MRRIFGPDKHEEARQKMIVEVLQVLTDIEKACVADAWTRKDVARIAAEARHNLITTGAVCED